MPSSVAESFRPVPHQRAMDKRGAFETIPLLSPCNIYNTLSLLVFSQEDDLIIEMVKKLGNTKWSLIAKALPGRIGKQCRERLEI